MSSLTVALAALGQVDGAQLRGFGPAFDRHLAALGIDADCDLAGKAPRSFLDQRGVANGDRAEDDAGKTAAQPLLDMGDGPNSATELNRK